MKVILEKIRKRLVAVCAEIPAFCELTKVTLRLASKTVKKQDVAPEKVAFAELRAKTKNVQVALVALAVISAFAFVMHRGEEGSGLRDVINNDEECRIDYKANLTVVASKNATPEKGVGYVSFGGFAVLQYLSGESAVLARMENNAVANLVAAMSGNLANVSESDEIGNIIYVKTTRQYTDGQSLASGVYIYEGIVTYQTANGASKSVKAFREMDEVVAKRKMQKDKEKRLEEEERNAKPIDGYTIPLPKKSLVKSICGLQFGRPPAEVEKNLGHRVEGRPISANNNSATFKLKKPFRLCDRVKVTYKGDPPFMVLSAVEFMGYVDKTKINALSCKDEVSSVAKMLASHFNLEYEDKGVGENDGKYYVYIHLPRSEGSFDIEYSVEDARFTIKYGCRTLIQGYYYDEVKEHIIKRSRDRKEGKKKSLKLPTNEGADIL